VASRFVKGGSHEAPWLRRVLSQILNALFRRILSLPVRYFSSGFRLYHFSVLKEIKVEGRNPHKNMDGGMVNRRSPFELRP
jgi:hypothetical protein